MKTLFALVALVVLVSPSYALDHDYILCAANAKNSGTNQQARMLYGKDLLSITPFNRAKDDATRKQQVSFNLGIGATTPLNTADLLSNSDFLIEGNVKWSPTNVASPGIVLGVHCDTALRAGGFFGLCFSL
jgi:hypothetical protein